MPVNSALLCCLDGSAEGVVETAGDGSSVAGLLCLLGIAVYFAKVLPCSPLASSLVSSRCSWCLSLLLCCLVLDKMIWVRLPELCVSVGEWMCCDELLSSDLGEPLEVSPSCMWTWTWILVSTFAEQ